MVEKVLTPMKHRARWFVLLPEELRLLVWRHLTIKTQHLSLSSACAFATLW